MPIEGTREIARRLTIAIDRQIGGGGSVGTVDLTPQGLIAAIEDLVTLPEVALRIAQMVDDPNSSSFDIGREISRDAAMTARLLRIANGAAFGQQGRIASVSRAITVLGVKRVRDLTVGLTAIHAFDGIDNELVTMESFWRHSVLCAVAADQLAARRDRGQRESPFIAGLLHDIGQLVLFSRVPALARQALLMSVDSVDDLDLYQCERAVMLLDHAAVGAALAQKWKLPAVLQECIRFHHEPELAQEFPLEVATIHIANSIAVLAEVNSLDLNDAPRISIAALQVAKLEAAGLPDLVLRTQKSAADVLPLLLAA